MASEHKREQSSSIVSTSDLARMVVLKALYSSGKPLSTKKNEIFITDWRRCQSKLFNKIFDFLKIVIKRQSKCKDPSTLAEISIKLQHAERKLNEFRSALMALGREAIIAMFSVEDQQQRIAFRKLLTMMILEKQLNESSSQSVTMQRDADVPPVLDDTISDGPDVPQDEHQNDSYFIAKVSFRMCLVKKLLKKLKSL
ncbi:hypothetical protein HYC85_029096 [Camellia sinensis]|uniref:Uncharacterized protein n=1 Tax=Camellia sinensis TaxID=4442 RepID=A0A7J7FX56_CAMSI|nr:hypothetical protein HYC85_029096 [Camellia sinensis]